MCIYIFIASSCNMTPHAHTYTVKKDKLKSWIEFFSQAGANMIKLDFGKCL